MPSCDMCGAQGKLFRVLVEETEMYVCQKCSKFGKILANPVTFIKKKVVLEKSAKPEPVEMIVEGYSDMIKKRREELGLTQEELAKKIAERESIIQKVEISQIEPSISLARKLEKFLSIRLVEQYEDKGGSLSTKSKSAEFTIGDMVKIKQRR
ncbi:MAG: multiprotein bridging factor aMBF1 [Candidatus Woesearchaeota archaeon]|nr:multiprotein bridging factor aMBF1 [Candidatus Woesearchaeota archaeon]